VLGFTLSKLNLLILVAAIFSIMAFFLFHLSTVTAGFEAKQLMEQYSRSASIIISSQNSCTSKSYFLQPYLQTAASGKMYYLMKISGTAVTAPSGAQQNLLIFSIRPRKDPDLILAADSFSTNSTIVFCDNVNGTINCAVDPPTGVMLDPQKALPINAFYLVKQISSGTSYLYVIPCNLGACDSVKSQANDAVIASGGTGFRC